MKLRSKKGFTIIELVIVIAVIGILTAVLVPTFINLTNKANEAADQSLVKNLNTALKAEEQLLGNPKNETLQDAVEDLKAEGYLLENLISKSGEDLIWNQPKNEFILNKDSKYSGKDYWQIVKEVPAYAEQKYSYYAGQQFNKNVPDLKYGFDAGENTNIETLNYIGNGSTSQLVAIRTNGGNLTIDAKDDVVKHYGDAESLNIKAVAGSSYHENGNVKFLEISKGRIVLEQKSEVKHIHVNAKESTDPQLKPTVFEQVIIAKDSNVKMPALSRDDVEIGKNGTLVVAFQKGTEDVTEQTNLDYVWLTRQGVYEQIKVSDSKTSAGNVWVNTSDKSAETKSAAQQIANNIGLTATVGAQEYNVTVNEETRDIVLKDDDENVAYTITADEQGNTIVKDSNNQTVTDATIANEVKSGSVEKVADKEDIEKGATLFAGGTGSEKDPFIIFDYESFQNISKLYEDGYYYFKVKDGVTQINCSDWKKVSLYGSFDGNGVIINNLDNTLFGETWDNGEEKPCEIQNFIVNSNMNLNTTFGSILVGYAHNYTNIEKVNIFGQAMNKTGCLSSFIGCGKPDSSGSTSGNGHWVIKDCISNATLINAGSVSGFIGNPWFGNGGANADSSVLVVDIYDSIYTGRASASSSKAYYIQQGAGYMRLNEHFTAEFLDQYSIGDYYNVSSKISSKWTIGSENNTLQNDGTAKSGITIKNATTLNTVSMATLPANKGDTFTIQKANNATTAVVSLIISPDDANHFGCFTATYLEEEINIASIAAGATFSSNEVKYFDIGINHPNTGAGVVNNMFNVVNDKYGVDTHCGASVRITQYDANGGILNVTTIKIAESTRPN